MFDIEMNNDTKKKVNKIDSYPHMMQHGCWMQLSLIKSLIDVYDVSDVTSFEKIYRLNEMSQSSDWLINIFRAKFLF